MTVVKINKSFLNDDNNIINENIEYQITESKDVDASIISIVREILHIINYKFAIFSGKEIWKEKEIDSEINIGKISFEIKVKKSFEKSIKELLQTLVEKKLVISKLVGTKNYKNKIINVFKIGKIYIQIDFLITEDKLFLYKKEKIKFKEPILATI